MPDISLRGALAMIVTIALAAACAATADREAAPDADSAVAEMPAILPITARDYAFDMPDTVPAGVTTVRLTNGGTEMHHVWLVKLADGKTIDDLLRESAGDRFPSWAVGYGGPNSPAPGGQSSAVVDLAPGQYAVLCVIPAADGQPHLMKGMMKTLTVTPSGSRAVAPDADITMTLTDYDFRMSAPLTAGTHTIAVRTDSTQQHEVVIARLAPGKTAADLLAWIQKMDGPPPAAPVGGIVGLAPGRENLITVDLVPGEYALVCFMPDARDGKPHVAHGMVKQITIG